MPITKIKVASRDWTNLALPGRRSLLMLLPDGTQVSATATIGGTQVPVTVKGVNATTHKAVGVMVEVFLRNDATAADVKGSLGTLASVGTKSRSVRLNDGQTATLAVTTPEGTHTITVGGINAYPPDTDPDTLVVTTYIVLATVRVTLTDAAEPGALV